VAAVGIGLISRVSAPWHLFALYGLVYAIGQAGTSVGPVSVLITRWFPHHRGLAASSAISGNAIGQLVLIMLLASLLTSLGWRTSFAALGIANTMLMSVFERTREIGTLMALGTTPREILALFLTESALIGAAGGLFGSAIGGSVVKVLAVVGIQPPSSVGNVLDLPLGTTIYAHFSWGTLSMFFSLALIVAMLSALYPAFLASRQEPVEALRHV
jgi:predicted lysophospholipase L1 biosynthesis ABC-type transport system permease subunit